MTKFKNIVVAVAALVTFTNITYAQAVKPTTYSVSAEDPLKVKYLGDEGGYLIFQVVSQSNEPSKARFTIEDKNEGELYSSGLKANLNPVTVKIEKIADDMVLDFKLTMGRKTYIKTFSVNTSLVETTTVAETDITKL